MAHPQLSLVPTSQPSDIVVFVNSWSSKMLAKLENITDFTSAKRIRQEAAAMQATVRELTRDREDSISLQNQAGVVKVKTEAKIGAMTLALKEAMGTAQKRGPGRPRKDGEKLRHHGDAISENVPMPTSEEMGLHREDRRRFEAIAQADKEGKLDAYKAVRVVVVVVPEKTEENFVTMVTKFLRPRQYPPPRSLTRGRTGFIDAATGRPTTQNRVGQVIFYVGRRRKVFAKVFGQLGLVCEAVR